MQTQQNTQSTYLFVYGTLMSGMENPFSATLQKSANYVGSASVHGLLFDYNEEYPCAVCSIYKKDLIYGELYKLSQPNSVLLELDAYEDCHYDEPGKSLYIRCIVPIVKHNEAKQIYAWMYFWNQPIVSLREISHGDYRKHSS